METKGFSTHDHSACISSAVSAVDTQCQTKGLQLTPVRRRVLEILLEEHRALGAYDILERLREDGLGSQPPVAYRALDFLVGNGFAHRIERLNAFVACTHPGDAHEPAFLICRECGSVAETQADNASVPLAKSIEETGFEPECTVIEVRGLCPDCKSSQQSTTGNTAP